VLAIQQFFIAHHNHREWLVRLSYFAQILIVVVGILTYIPAVKFRIFGKEEDQLIAETIREVKDSTDNVQSRVNTDSLFADCQRTGLAIKRYRTALLSRILERNNVPAKDTAKYISRVDSAIIDPITANCNRVNQFAQMVWDLSMLIRAKDPQGIGELFDTYHISSDAKAIELRDGQKLYRGLLRDFLIDNMQDLTPTFREIKPPAFRRGDELIDQLVFTTI